MNYVHPILYASSSIIVLMALNNNICFFSSFFLLLPCSFSILLPSFNAFSISIFSCSNLFSFPPISLTSLSSSFPSSLMHYYLPYSKLKVWYSLANISICFSFSSMVLLKSELYENTDNYVLKENKPVIENNLHNHKKICDFWWA